MASLTKDSGIYCIEHTASGKRYIGSSQNINRRIKVHVRNLRRGIHHSAHLQAAWNLYGEDGFDFVVLMTCPFEELLEREQFEIDFHDSVSSGYNSAMFAGAPMRGRKHSEESRSRMRVAQQGRDPISEETRKLMGEAGVEREAKKKEDGFVVSDETRAKLVAKLTGRPVSEVSREKARLSNTGKLLSDEHRKKLSESHKGKIMSESNKAAIALANTGKKRSDEFKESMSIRASNRTPEHQAKLVASQIGRKATDEAKENMRKAQTGKVKSEESKAKLRISLALYHAKKAIAIDV